MHGVEVITATEKKYGFDNSELRGAETYAFKVTRSGALIIKRCIVTSADVLFVSVAAFADGEWSRVGPLR